MPKFGTFTFGSEAFGTSTFGSAGLTAQLVPDAVVPYVELSVVHTDLEEVTISRVTGDGTQIVRGMDAQSPIADDTFYGADYEFPQSDSLTYIAVVYDGTITTTLGPVTIEGLDRGGDFLWPVGRPNESMQINLEIAPDLEHEITQAVSKVIDRPDPVVVSHARHWWSGKIRFVTETDDERRRFFNIIGSGRPVVFSPRPNFGFDEIQYLAVGNVTEVRTVPRYGGETSRIWDAQCVRVAMPPAHFYIAVGNTWQDVLDLGESWLDKIVGNVTWGQLTGI